MRTFLALVIFAAGMFALDSAADADTARKAKRHAKQQQQQKYHSRQEVDWACEERARHEDPTGLYAAYPCWAREALSRGKNIDTR